MMETLFLQIQHNISERKKSMKIERVIRFQKPQNIEDVNEAVRKVESTGIGFRTLEDVQSRGGIPDGEFHSQVVMEKSGPSAFDQLKRRMEIVLAGRASNMIGVFGINADNVIGQMMKDPIFQNVNFLGKIEQSPGSDIYNYIAAILMDYLNQKVGGRRDLEYERREAFRTIETIYDSHETHGTALDVLHQTAMKAKRDSYILTALNQINRIDNYVSYSREREYKFLLIVELQKVDYVTLKRLSNLQSSELIIITYSLFKLEYALDSETMGSIGGNNIIGKFFPAGNFIMAD